MRALPAGCCWPSTSRPTWQTRFSVRVARPCMVSPHRWLEVLALKAPSATAMHTDALGCGRASVHGFACRSARSIGHFRKSTRVPPPSDAHTHAPRAHPLAHSLAHSLTRARSRTGTYARARIRTGRSHTQGCTCTRRIRMPVARRSERAYSSSRPTRECFNAQPCRCGRQIVFEPLRLYSRATE